MNPADLVRYYVRRTRQPQMIMPLTTFETGSTLFYSGLWSSPEILRSTGQGKAITVTCAINIILGCFRISIKSTSPYPERMAAADRAR
ncbi:hypothetical protein BDW59DRAFT_95188 [Aspergillus cavernicola]|uniref:Uncharacterized protein n=1 Tax=Aspergillus cavernicola TaxID=176166 RepID=A0ABR4IZ81_9EURO